jgi:hypothetical protein
MMANSITLAKDFDVSKITYSDVKVLDNGGKVIYVSYNKAPLILQTPEMSAPFGLQKWSNDNNRDKYTLDLSFKGLDQRSGLQSFYNVLNSLDKKLVEDGFTNQQSWFRGKKLPSKEVVEALYTPLIKYAKDKDTGEPTDKYPPTFKMNVPFKDDKFMCEVYDDKRNQADLSSMETKGSRVTAIMQCTGLWMAGGKFGSSWRVLQMKVVPNQKISGYAFQDNPEDKMKEEDIEDEQPDAHEVLESAIKSDDDADEENEDDGEIVSDSEDELEKPVVPQPKPATTRRVNMKK